MLKILITSTSFQDTPGKHKDLLASQNWSIDYLRGPLKSADLIEIIANYDGIICGDDDYNQEVLKIGSLGRLKILSKYGVGLDKIDLKSAKEFGIKVTNCPGVNQNSVAEHVFSLLLTFEKNIHHQHTSVQNYSWNRKIGNEIFGKKIGIIGLGAIGKEVVRISKGFGLEIYVNDISYDDHFLKSNPELNIVSIDEIFDKCNYISLHLPLNSSTEKLIDYNSLNKFKNYPIIINTARGGLINDEAIVFALKKGILKGYLCDVLNEEPISNNEILVGNENIIITPHIGSRTYQNVEKQAIMSINNLLDNI